VLAAAGVDVETAGVELEALAAAAAAVGAAVGAAVAAEVAAEVPVVAAAAGRLRAGDLRVPRATLPGLDAATAAIAAAVIGADAAAAAVEAGAAAVEAGAGAGAAAVGVGVAAAPVEAGVGTSGGASEADGAPPPSAAPPALEVVASASRPSALTLRRAIGLAHAPSPMYDGGVRYRLGTFDAFWLRRTRMASPLACDFCSVCCE
jgi:hypothetical protein